MSMDVRIESNGEPLSGTKVLRVETGEEIDWISDVRIDLPLDDIVRAELTVPLVGLNVLARATVVGFCPHCGARVGVAGAARRGLARLLGAPAPPGES